MRYRSISKCLPKVADIGTQSCPHAKQDRKSSNDCRSEHQSDDLRRRSRVVTEDVVYLLLCGITSRRLRNGQRDVGVAGDIQVEDGALVGRRRAE